MRGYYKDIILPNHDLTVFNISEVSESYLIKIVSQVKSSRSNDVFDSLVYLTVLQVGLIQV